MKLKDKTAIVTGGASNLGAATATLFAKEGATVIVADVLEQDGRAVVDAIRSEGGKAEFHNLNVTEETAWENLVDRARADYQRIDVLVNCAGLTGSSGVDPLDVETWGRLISVNATGVFLGMRAVIPHMTESGGGAIVNLASIASMIGTPTTHMAYSASKGAVAQMTRTVAVQNGRNNIRANTISPGIMPAMRSSRLNSEENMGLILQLIPMGKLGEPEDVAKACLFMASEDSSYITGVNLAVDGGFISM